MRTMGGFFLRLLPYVLAAIYLWAGLAKLQDMEAFARGIESFRFFPQIATNVLALTVPIIEIAAALLLVTKSWRRQGALLSSILAAVFALLFVWAAVRGLDVKCGCFGQGLDMPKPASIARAAVLLALSIICYMRATRKR